MATNVNTDAADLDNKDIIDFDDIFHPLLKLDSRPFEQEQRSLRYNAQPVLINDAVYIPGSDSNNHAVIWKYSLSRRSWSPIPPPQEITDSNFTVTEYQSQLLLIGKKYNQKGMLIIMNKFDEDKGWLPIEDVTTPPIDSMQSASDFSAVSEGRCLIVSWVKDEQFQLLIFDGLTWKEVDGPKCCDGYRRPNMIVHERILYLSDCRHDSIYSVPLESLLCDGSETWDRLPDLPYKHKLHEGAANLTLLNFSILATLIPSFTKDTSLVLALEPRTKSWIDLGEISCEVGHTTSPRLVGLPPGSAGNTKLIAMGQIVRVERGVPVGGQVLIPYTALQRHFAVLEISATVTTFNPNDEICLRALMKCTSYNVLTELEKSQHKREMVMDKANFTIISCNRLHPELYPGLRSAASCVQSWLESSAKHTLPPTWDNFLHIILQEIKLSDIAKGIEKYLTSTVVSPPEESQTEHPRAGFEQVALIRSELDSLSESLANIESHSNITLALKDIKERFKACRDKCHEAFRKLGEEKDEHEQQVKEMGEQLKQLQRHNEELIAKTSNDPSQSPPAKRQKIDDSTPTLAKLSLLKTSDGTGVRVEIIKRVAPHWRDLGILMDFDKEGTQLKNIEEKYSDPIRCCQAMFRYWLNGNGRGPHSWNTLIELLEDCDHATLADEIRNALAKQ